MQETNKLDEIIDLLKQNNNILNAINAALWNISKEQNKQNIPPLPFYPQCPTPNNYPSINEPSMVEPTIPTTIISKQHE